MRQSESGFSRVSFAREELFKAMRDVIPDDYVGLIIDKIENLIRVTIAASSGERR